MPKLVVLTPTPGWKKMAVVGPFGGAAESQISLDSAISPFEGAPGSASDGHGVGVAAGAGGEGNSIFDLGFEPVEEAPPFKPAFLAPEALTKPETLLPLLDRVLGAKSETLFDVGLERTGPRLFFLPSLSFCACTVSHF